MNLLIGCPVSHREWILPLWFEHVYTAAGALPIDFLFLVAEDDEGTIEILDEHGADMIVTPAEDRRDIRHWTVTRYRHMASLRNHLLEEVRARKPDIFVSLDSDILLHPDAINSALEILDTHPDAWAVGSKCFLSSADRWHPNMAYWSNGRESRRFTRRDSNEVLKVDVLMAVKFMREQAYAIDYESHRWGEDFGWSANAIDAGSVFYWDGRVANKHVMKREFLDKVDPRVGF